MQNIRCGNPKHNREIAKEHYHGSVAEVRECYAAPKGILSIQEEVMAHDNEQAARAEIEAEQGYERHLENQGYWQARADEDHEMAMGIDPFNPLGPAFGLMA